MNKQIGFDHGILTARSMCGWQHKVHILAAIMYERVLHTQKLINSLQLCLSVKISAQNTFWTTAATSMETSSIHVVRTADKKGSIDISLSKVAPRISRLLIEDWAHSSRQTPSPCDDMTLVYMCVVVIMLTPSRLPWILGMIWQSIKYYNNLEGSGWLQIQVPMEQ